MLTEHKDHIIKGMACAATAYFMLTMMMVFSKLLTQTHNVIEASFYRNLIAVLPLLFLIFVMGKRDIMTIRSNPKIMILRGVIGTFGMFLTFGAFALLPLAEATVLLFSSSIFLPILSYFFLKEHISRARWSAIAFGMIGVLIMARPTGDVNVLGIGVALAAAIVHSIIGIILRHLGKSEPPLTVTFYFLLIGTIISAVPMPVMATPLDLNAAWLILGLGMTGLTGQAFLSSAFKFAPASVVTIFNYTGLIWATFFGWWLWGDWPSTPVWIGGGIVIGANIFIILRERYLHNRAQETERQREQEETLS
jgi:drug/metabolite transporter (DMT)-like permease